MILTDRSVLLSIVVGVAVLAVNGLLPARLRRSETVAVLGIAAGFWVAAPDVDRYRELPARFPEWMVPVLALAVVAVGVAVAATARSGTSRPNLTVAVALATAGVFLCVPETGVVRFVVGPMVLVGLSVGIGLARPLASFAVLVAVAGLAWLALIDGHTRGSAVVGAAACIGAVAFVPLIERASWSADGVPPVDWRSAAASPDRAVLAGHGVLAFAVLACSRWAGIQRSTTVAAVQVVMVLTVTGGVLWWLQAAAARSPRSSEPLEGTA
ncbi:MAG: hypothetical protein OEV40_06160 [Acidimicrobiia bacterium]|nr:hypothetical protein [Acidimicrobiia bacterium]